MADDKKYLMVYVFNGSKASFPSGVFVDRDSAIAWISENKLSGTLTEYPVGIGVYDWAIQGGYFTPQRADKETPHFIERFTSGRQWHRHFENGE
jgi:hypothetical protein